MLLTLPDWRGAGGAGGAAAGAALDAGACVAKIADFGLGATLRILGGTTVTPKLDPGDRWQRDAPPPFPSSQCKCPWGPPMFRSLPGVQFKPSTRPCTCPRLQTRINT